MPGPQPRIPDEVRQQVLNDLQAGKTYRQISQARGVSQGVIAQVKRQGNKAMRKPDPKPPATPSTTPEGGDGLREYVPGRGVPERSPEHSSKSSAPDAQSTRSNAPDAQSTRSTRSEALDERSTSTSSTARAAAPSAPARPLPARSEQCPHCRSEWRLDAGDESPATCPVCHMVLDHQLAAANEQYSCTDCGFAFTLDAGDNIPANCPRCGGAF